MEKEFLKVKNFGPIKDLDIEIKPLMVFIGESGSGKSAILKLMSLLRWIHKQNNLRNIFNKLYSLPKKDFSFEIEELFETSSILEFINESTQIIFKTNNAEYRYENGNFIYPEKELENVSFHKVAFISENRGILPDVYKNTIYKKDNLGRRYSIELPYYLNKTFDLFDTAYKKTGKRFYICSTNLNFHYSLGNYIDFFVEGDGFKIKLENASSGTKTALPIELIVHYLTQYFDFQDVIKNNLLNLFPFGLEEIINNASSMEEYFNSMLKGIEELAQNGMGNEELSIFIEEPELSLFPAAQRRLINRLIKDCFVDNKQKDCTTRLAFATHSPYIVNHLNLLIQAFDKQNTEFTEGASISYDDLSVWLIQNGKLRDLKAKNQHFIDVMSLSDDINDIYDKYKVIKNG